MKQDQSAIAVSVIEQFDARGWLQPPPPFQAKRPDPSHGAPKPPGYRPVG